MKKNVAILFIVLFFLIKPISSNATAYYCEDTEKLKSVEKTICKSDMLSNLDDELNKVYSEKISTVKLTNYLKYSQNKWLREERDRCKESTCIEAAYRKRINELRTWEDKGMSIAFNIQGVWKEQTHIPSFKTDLIIDNKTIEWGDCKKTNYKIVNNYADTYLDDWAHVTIFLEHVEGNNCIFGNYSYVEFSLANFTHPYNNQLGKIDIYESYEKRKEGYHSTIQLFHYDKKQ